MTGRLAHRWPGFSDQQAHDLLAASGLLTECPLCLPGPLEVRIWRARRLPEQAASSVADATFSGLGVPA